VSLLHEVALTPDVFREDGYVQPGICRVCLDFLRPILLEETLVRNLRDGAWARQFLESDGGWHPSGRELVKKLVERKRLVLAGSELEGPVCSDADWRQEALLSHRRSPFAAVIVGAKLLSDVPERDVVCSAERVHRSRWWAVRGCSIRLSRHTDKYLEALALPLRFANSLLFIDPHLDPSQPRYGKFWRLIEGARRTGIQPAIELHRVCYEGSGEKRRILKCEELRHRFSSLDGGLRASGLRACVHVWDDFHDRYLLSDLIGIVLSNGFDESPNGQAKTTWSRLSRSDLEDVFKEFSRSSGRHELRYEFSVPNH